MVGRSAVACPNAERGAKVPGRGLICVYGTGVKQCWQKVMSRRLCFCNARFGSGNSSGRSSLRSDSANTESCRYHAQIPKLPKSRVRARKVAAKSVWIPLPGVKPRVPPKL